MSSRRKTAMFPFARARATALLLAVLAIVVACQDHVEGCQFYPIGEYLKFVRVPENLELDTEILSLEVHPRNHLTIMPVDKEEDARFFAYKELNRTHVSVTLAQSLEDLVDAESPRNLLKFRVICDYANDDDSLVSSHLSVTVYVEDINDHAPEFIGAPYHVTVDELTPTGVTIFRGIRAIDGDKPNTPNSDVHYAIVKGNEQGKFSLESGHRTALILRKSLDYDSGDREFVLVITATDRGTPTRSANTTVRIIVVDNDDLDPKFTRDYYKAKIYEFYPMPNHPILHQVNFTPPIRASDRDRDINAPLRYDIISGNERDFFHLSAKNGSLYLKRPIDLEAEPNLPGNTFVLQIHASQVDNPLKMAVARAEVEVLDLNDNLPEFEVDLYNISIVENLPNGFSVLQVIARDRDQAENGIFDYQLVDRSGAFSVDPRSGWLTVKDQRVLDREARDRLDMRVYAIERRPSVILASSKDDRKSNGSYVDVQVTLLDANDNNPIFVPANLYELVARADSKVGTVLGQVHAVDDDLGPNGLVMYKLQKPGNSSSRVPPFAVDRQTGVITVAKSPIVEGRHAIFVEAADQPTNPSERRFSLAVVTVDVFRSDGSESWEPDFVGAPYEFWVGANVPVGTSVGQIRINDAVKTTNLIYDLLHGYQDGVPFAVEERSGTITVVDEIERFQRSTYEFEAVVTDEREMTLITNVSIHVVDPNDDRGVFTRGTTTAPLVYHVKENVPGAFIGQVLPHNGTIASRPANTRFLIVNQQDVPDIGVTEDGTLFAPDGLDRETRQNYSITVIAESSKGIAVFQVTVVVDDENDHAPTFSSPMYEGRIPENSPNGTEVITTNPIVATDKDEGYNGKFVFGLRDEGVAPFTIDSNTGRVYFLATKNRRLDREEKAYYEFRVIAVDGGGLKSEARLNVSIEDENDNTPSFIRMIVLPDQGVRVSNEKDDDNSQESISDSMESATILTDPDRRKVQPLLPSTTKETDRRPPLILVPENATIGTPILRLLAEDRDAGENATITYSVINESIEETNDLDVSASVSASASTSTSTSMTTTQRRYLHLDSRTGELSVARSLPVEATIRVSVMARDGGGLSDSIAIRLRVVDVNDHPPVFEKSWYTFDVPEGVYKGRVVGHVRAIDRDHGPNADVRYELLRQDDNRTAPRREDEAAGWLFDVAPRDGAIRVGGTLDRELMSVHRLVVVARDAGQDLQLTSTVEVEVNVLDVNDNAPLFHGYDEIDQATSMPVYRASIREDAPIGSLLLRVHANDTDFAGNGNGLVLFDLHGRTEDDHASARLFAVDSKEGSITTAAELDFETTRCHRLMVTASDLGSPISLTSSALVTISVDDVEDSLEKKEKEKEKEKEKDQEKDQQNGDKVIDGNDGDSNDKPGIEGDEGGEDEFEDDADDEGQNEVRGPPTFKHRYYEVEVEENAPVPILLTVMELADRRDSSRVRYSVVADGSDARDHFAIDPKNGTLYLATSVDRENRDRYEARVRVDRVKLGRGMPVMIYPVVGERLNGLAPNEARVVVRVKDTNDNAPRFKSKERPILAAIPTTAHYGYEVVKVEATDADEGLNGEIRYQILGREDAPRFAIDPMSGQVRSVASFGRDAGRVFGFDVKATDRRGAENGRSSIANVFVYVLDDQKQVVMVVGQKPMDIEPRLDNFTAALQNVTGLDVRVRKLEPHIEKNLIDTTSTDVYLYAIDPHLNVMIDMDALHNVFHSKKVDIKRELEEYRVLDIAGSAPRRTGQRYLLSTLEVGVVVLGCVVFVGALATALCITCIRRNKRRKRREKMMFPNSGPFGFALADPAGTLQKPSLFPTFVDGLRYDPDSFCTDMHRRRSLCEHGANCVRFHTMAGGSVGGKHASRTTATGKGLEASATSLHSSGQDSGIVARASCHCSHSSSPSSGDSSNGYEDSLRSLHRRERCGTNDASRMSQDGCSSVVGRRANRAMMTNRRQRFNSFSNVEGLYGHEMTLQRDQQRCCTASSTIGTDKKRKKEHRRAHSEAENNITETVIHEHPNIDISLAGSLPNTSSLHGTTTRTSHMLY